MIRAQLQVSYLSRSYPVPLGYFTAQPAKSLVELIFGEMGITVIDWDIYYLLIHIVGIFLWVPCGATRGISLRRHLQRKHGRWD